MIPSTTCPSALEYKKPESHLKDLSVVIETLLTLDLRDNLDSSLANTGKFTKTVRKKGTVLKSEPNFFDVFSTSNKRGGNKIDILGNSKGNIGFIFLSH